MSWFLAVQHSNLKTLDGFKDLCNVAKKILIGQLICFFNPPIEFPFN